MKKILTLIIFLLIAVTSLLPAQKILAQEPDVFLTIFYGDGCPHCHKEQLFLDQLKKEIPQLKVRELEVWGNQENAKLMSEVSQRLKIKNSGVPLTIIGDEVLVGYLNDETSGARIRSIVNAHLVLGCSDLVGEMLSEESTDPDSCTTPNRPEEITLPFVGSIDIKNWSLPLLTIVIGILDGFNPCAMWVLFFLISLLLGMTDRKKMWLLGGAFILTSGLIYFMFLSAWLNLFLFLGFIIYIRYGIGLVAIGSGIYHLREYLVNRSGACKVTNEEQKTKIMNRIRKVMQQEFFVMALVGIIGVAVAVNMIELVCSAGLPAIYTQILSLADLSTPVYYLYLMLYILFYMLDDLLIFIIAMTTLQLTGISSKYTRYSNLVGGVVILIIGILLIFKPGWIMFG